jgi:nucleotide-binding universal stress UspA family protein
MYRTILVPLDGSTTAEQALGYARSLADKSKAGLVLIRVVGVPDFLIPFGPAERDKALGDADDYLNSLIAHREGDQAVSTVTYYGDVAPTIVEEAVARIADLIVMSTHGRSNVERIVYGSVAGEILRKGGIPTLLVPRGCDQPWLPDRPARLLIPLDGSDQSHGILTPALELADTLGAAVTLLRVVAPVKYVQVAEYEDRVAVPTEGISAAEAEAYLNAVAAERCAGHRPIATLAVEGADIAQTIAAAAEDQGASAIAMATHGRSGLASLVTGSVATAVLQRATAPILMIRPTRLN